MLHVEHCVGVSHSCHLLPNHTMHKMHIAYAHYSFLCLAPVNMINLNVEHAVWRKQTLRFISLTRAGSSAQHLDHTLLGSTVSNLTSGALAFWASRLERLKCRSWLYGRWNCKVQTEAHKHKLKALIQQKCACGAHRWGLVGGFWYSPCSLVGKHRCITEFRKAQGADQGTNLKACARAVHTIQDL